MNRNEISKELRIFEDIIIDAIDRKKNIEHVNESFNQQEAVIKFEYNFKEYTIIIKEN